MKETAAKRGEETVYGRFAHVYDRLMADMPYPAWLAFLEQCFARYGKPTSVVDLGCGTGSLSIPLAEAGYRVLGLDLSADMLAVAKRKAQGLALPPGASLQFLQGDMRNWRAEAPADCVFSFCDCLNYLLEEEDIRRVFRSVHDGLAPGGLFVFDVHAPAQILAYAEGQPYVWDEDGLAYIWTCAYDPERIQVEHRLTFFAAERDPAGTAGRDSAGGDAAGDRFIRFREVHRQRAYLPDWLSAELRRAGFVVLDRCADFHWMCPDEDAERLFFVARKPFSAE